MFTVRIEFTRTGDKATQTPSVSNHYDTLPAALADLVNVDETAVERITIERGQ